MKRSLYWALLCAACIGLGCSSKPDGAKETAAQAEAPIERKQTTYEFKAAEVEGNLERPPPSGEAGQPQKVEENAFSASSDGGMASRPGGSFVPLAPSTTPTPAIAPEPVKPIDIEPPVAAAEAFPTNPLRSMRMARSAPRTAPRIAAEPPAGESPPQSADAFPATAAPSSPDAAAGEIASPDTQRLFAERMAAEQAAQAEMERRMREESARASSAAGAQMESAPQLPSAAAPAADIPSASIPAAPTNELFNVVRVFYGTDRLALEPLAESWSQRGHRFMATGIALLAALVFAVAALCAPGFRWSLMALAVCGFIATAGFGYRAASTTLALARQAEKEGVRYGTDRTEGGKVELGICEVTIPKTHQTGELEAPSILRLEVSEDARKHIVLRKTERLESDAYYEQLRQRVAQSPRKELFVFIHGFNTSFEDAARRTAQMANDLPFEGAPIFYSWPANDMYLLSYAADETNVAWAAPHLKKFLLSVVAESKAESINLIAHSMGNRALTAVLRELDLEFKQDARMFNQVVLAAPDIDAADFRDNIAPAIRGTAQRVTLYASSGDQALAASQLVHRYPRAGDTRPELVVAEGLDTIDVSLVGSSPWGHSYYGSSDPVLRDLALLLRESLPPDRRQWLSSADHRGRMYWVFQGETNPSDSMARQPAVAVPLTAPR